MYLAPRSTRLLLQQKRCLFSLPNFSLPSETQTFQERKILPYSQQDMYDVVADVPSYPLFVPFCTGSRILNSQTRDQIKTMDAELTVGFMSFKESYVSKVTCTPIESVEAVASSERLFKTLSTIWRFQPASPQSPHPSAKPLHSKDDDSRVRPSGSSPGPTLVTLDLVFAFENPLHAAASASFSSKVSKLMVSAFEKRCLEIYGPGTR